jgi:hypothetical protein
VPRCLYCSREDRPFTSVEHIVPEGLGNKEMILSVGVVCDKCNNGVLSQLDRVLIEFDLIGLMRVHHGVTSKTGRLPKVQFGDALVERLSPGHVHINAVRSKSIWDNPNGFSFKFRHRRPMNARHCRELVRALFKVALGHIYLGHDGPEFAFSERFDPIREIVRGVRPFHGYLVVGANQEILRQNQARGSVMLMPLADEHKKTIVIIFEYCGVLLVTDLETRDPEVLKDRLPEGANLFEF